MQSRQATLGSTDQSHIIGPRMFCQGLQLQDRIAAAFAPVWAKAGVKANGITATAAKK